MKDRIMLKLLGAVAIVLICNSLVAANPYPPKKSWEYLGAKNIGLTYDKDVIYVENSRELYDAIELRTDKKQIDLHRCVIYYQNGDRQDVRLRRDNRGSESHVIELEGQARAINKIAIWGSRDYGKIFRAFDKGTVEVWGKRSNQRNDREDVQYYTAERYNDYDRDYDTDNRYSDRDLDRARRDRERAERDRERARRDRERAERAREEARRERDRRNRNRRGIRICP